MNARMFAARVALPVLAVGAVSAQASAADFDWKKFQGKTVTFLAKALRSQARSKESPGKD